MGEVFLAEDTRLKRRVALKSFTEKWATRPDAQRRLLHEARAAAALNHPNIAAVYDVLQIEGGAFIVMEYVGGETLADRLREGPMPPAAVAFIGLQLCDALAEAHAHVIVHRDLKPKNLALTPNGRLKVLDFGLAKPLVLGTSARSSPSSAGAGWSGDGHYLVGTLPYAPPEHLLGMPVDERSDIYSAGVVLYELLTWRRPFEGPTSAALAAAILYDTPPRPRALEPAIPEELERVVLKAMARDPGERYATAAAMKADLVSARQGTSTETTASWPLVLEMRTGRGRRRQMAVIALLFCGALLGAFRLERIYHASALSGAPPSGDLLAVVPFENATGDRAWTHLANGVSDDLTRALQRSGVPVKSRESAAQLKGLSDSEIARRLDVNRVVRGRISIEGGDVVLDASVTDASGAERWSRRYRRPLERPGGLSAAAATDLATVIRGGPPRLPSAPLHEASFKAYEAYQEGRIYWEQRTQEGLLKSIDYFKTATRLDPDYAQAWAGMADAYLILGVPTFGAFGPQEVRRLANEAALKALELDPSLAEAHASLAQAAYAYDWNWSAAEARFRKAIQLNPQYATAHHWYADYLTAMGRHEEAMAEIQTAARLEPLSILIHRDVAWHYFFGREYEAAVSHLEQTLRMDPHYAAARSLLGRALLEAGRPAEGLAELNEVAPDLPPAAALAFLAYAEAAAGQASRAEALLEELLHQGGQGYVSPYYVALVYVKLGRSPEAILWFEKGFDDHDTTMTTLKVDPRLDPLRPETRYQALVEKMKFPETP